MPDSLSPHEQLRAAQQAAKRAKSGHKSKWTRDSRGRNHPSEEEARWFDQMYSLEDRGFIVIEEIEPSFRIELHEYGDLNGRFLCNVKADMRYFDKRDGRRHVADYKGRNGDTAVSRLKHKMVRIQHGVEIELVGKYVERKAKAKAKAAFVRKHTSKK